LLCKALFVDHSLLYLCVKLHYPIAELPVLEVDEIGKEDIHCRIIFWLKGTRNLLLNPWLQLLVYPLGCTFQGEEEPESNVAACGRDEALGDITLLGLSRQ